MTVGYLSLVLHAHLPFVRHPEHEFFLEEDWLFEAITETYIPLIQAFENLCTDGIDFRITMSMTPPLLSMLNDPLLQYRYVRHIDNLIELSRREMERTRFLPEFNGLAKKYHQIYLECRKVFVERYNNNIITAFKKFQDLGKLEIITCCGTHGFLPLMVNEKAMQAQIRVAVAQHEKLLGRKPKGIWLAECGYKEGVDEILKENDIRFFFTDAHGILYSKPRPKYGIFSPVYCDSGVAAFGRDMETSKQVWSSHEGYPGDSNYRDFYRDIGYDLDFDYLKEFLPPIGIRTFTGIKYHRITGNTENKKPYNFQVAEEKAAEHAGNFMFNRQLQCKYLNSMMDRPPLVVSPYDAELFGHWWFEGPKFIEHLFRKIYLDQGDIELITPSEYLERHPENQVVQPSPGSWGYKGYNEYWLNNSNDWIYPHLHKIAQRMTELADQYQSESDSLLIRALNQAAREVLLAQSSDWAFIMTADTMVPYAVKRTREHVSNFHRLYDSIRANSIDECWLKSIENKNNIFTDIDFKIYL